MAALLLADNVEKHYELGRTRVPALRGVSFEIEAGEFLAIAGPSGCGKTTLMNILGCLDKPSAGRVFLDGTDMASLSDDQGADLRLGKLGFIFQMFNLIPVLNVIENVELPLTVAGVPKDQRRRRVGELVELVGLTEVVRHKPDELSGGQRQRVAIARALANEPEIVMADEPTANLDTDTSYGILKEMQRLNRGKGVTFIFATHDAELMSYAGRVIHLKDGLVTAQ